MSEYFLLNNIKFIPEVVEPPPTDMQLYYVKHWPVGDPYRDGRPEVNRMLPVVQTSFNEEWQNFYFNLTWHFWPAFTREFAAKRWESLNGDRLALMNGTGYPGDPPRANFIARENMTGPLPAYDKTRTMGGNVVMGVEEGDWLRVETLDGNASPPALQYVLDRPWLYFHCVLAFKLRVGLFPQGCVSADDIWQPTIAPLVSTVPMYLELDRLEKLAPGSPIPDPYYYNVTLWDRIKALFKMVFE